MNESEMINIVKKSFPYLQISDVQANTKGWDNDILILNQEIVFSFPKSKEVAAKVIDEIVLLNELALKKPLLEIPRYEIVRDNGEFKGVKYTFLKGKSLFESGTSRILNSKSSKLLGDFLTKLHRVELSALKGTNLGLVHTNEYWTELYESVKSNIFPFINHSQKKEIENMFNDFFCNPIYSTKEKSLIHGDLTVSNILYCHERELVSGIIDFTDAQLGDPAFDFAGLYWTFGPDFTKDVLSYYKAENKESIFRKVQSFYGLQPIFHNLIFAIKQNQRINWETTLDRFLYLNSLRNSN